MNCPRCGRADWSAPCPHCGFEGAADLVQLWSNLNFLLEQLGTWDQIHHDAKEKLRFKYGRWRREVEVELGLREPPLDAQAAQAVRLEITQLKSLFEVLPDWVNQGLLALWTAQELAEQTRDQVGLLGDRLQDAPPTEPPEWILLVLAQKRFQAETLENLQASGRLADATLYLSASAKLAAEIERLEVTAGLRPRPAPAPPPEERAPLPSPQPPRPSRPPREPLTWDRVWETVLSERTLYALLFLGVFMIFVAAVAWVVRHWDTLAPWLQVASLALFTATFYVLGWYLRVRLALRATGIALSAVASLLVPLDFYAIYLSGNLPAEHWPQVWLFTSAVCLGAYLLTVYWIQAEFFGYLVGAAAGSLLAAGMQVANLDPDWRQSGLTGLALLLALVGERLHRREDRWRVLAAPLWRVALAATTTILLLAFGWEFVGRAQGRAFEAALALDWWLGGALFVLALRRYPSQTVGLTAAVSFSVAAVLTQRALHVHWAWYALGWAMLAPVYLVAGWALTRSREDKDPIYAALGQLSVRYGTALTVLAALWPIFNLPAASIVHLVLAGSVALAARLWQRPRLLAFASLLLFSGVTARATSLGLTIGHLGLAWALLAILHVIVALRLGRARVRYDAPLYAAGWLIAGASVLLPMLTSNRHILTYTLANWMALNAWLALLAHGTDAPGLNKSLENRRLRPTLFHWAAAAPLLLWLWLAWGGSWPVKTRLLGLGGRYVEARLEWVYVLGAWALLGLGARLRRYRWDYGWPWHTIAHLCNLAAIFVPLVFYEQAQAAWMLLLASGFYFSSARVLHTRHWLTPGGLSLALGWLLGLDQIRIAPEGLRAALALLATLYSGAAWLLERYRGARRDFLLPLYFVAQGLTLAVFAWIVLPVLQSERTTLALTWEALGLVLLGLGMGIQAWVFDSQEYGHVAIWLLTCAAVWPKQVEHKKSHGTSATKTALLAVGYVLAERALYQACLARRLNLAWRRLARRTWRLSRQPLLFAGWLVSAGSVGLALIRNLVILGGGRITESWAVGGLLLVTGLYASSAWLFRRHPQMALRLVWLASLLAVAPWTVLTHLGWYVMRAPSAPRYAFSWAILALLQLLVGIGLIASSRRRAVPPAWGRPPVIVAHCLLPLALLWGLGDVPTSCLTLGLAITFYLIAVAIDWQAGNARFLYPAAALVPVWALYLLAYFAPQAPQTTYGLLLLAFTLPALGLGKWLHPRQKAMRWPLYLTAYGAALAGTLLVAHERPVLIGVLLFDTALAVLSAWTFGEPGWVYLASATLPAALALAMVEMHVPSSRQGWALIWLGGVYVWLGWLLRSGAGARLASYATPLLAAAFALIALGLPLSSQDRLGTLVGYGGAALLYALAAAWMRQPLLLTPAVGLALVPYWVLVLELKLDPINRGLALWPGIAVVLLLAYRLDWRWGIQPNAGGQPLEPFPWSDAARWPWALAERLTRWWAWPCYAVAFGGAAVGACLSLRSAPRLALALALAAVVYGLATARFRLRGWLLAGVVAAQLAALAAMRWLGWGEWAALAFAPLTWATALSGLWVERRLNEGSPLAGALNRGLSALQGWSRPLYWVLLVDVLVGQLVVFIPGGQSAWVSLSHAALLSVLATVWIAPDLAHAPPYLGLLAVGQYLLWQGATALTWPPVLASLALAYGLAGCGLGYTRQRGEVLPTGAAIWERPLWWGGWVVSALALALAYLLGMEVLTLVGRAVLDWPLVQPADVPQVQMAVSVMAVLSLLYLAYALTARKLWLAYGAVGLLLASWSVELLLVWGQREVQWYAVPAGLYLLGVGYLEWRWGSRPLARWIDRAALLLLFSTSFWQSLGDGGGIYALLMGIEGLAIVWWGSARRLRRLLYSGVAAVVLDVTGQLIEPVFSINVIVLATVGIGLLVLVGFIERRREAVERLSKELRGRLDEWE